MAYYIDTTLSIASHKLFVKRHPVHSRLIFSLNTLKRSRNKVLRESGANDGSLRWSWCCSWLLGIKIASPPEHT